MSFCTARCSCIGVWIGNPHFIQWRQVISIFGYIYYVSGRGSSGYIEADKKIQAGHIVNIGTIIQVAPMVCSSKAGAWRCISTLISLGCNAIATKKCNFVKSTKRQVPRSVIVQNSLMLLQIDFPDKRAVISDVDGFGIVVMLAVAAVLIVDVDGCAAISYGG